MKKLRLGHPILTIKIRYEPDIVTARQKTRRLSNLLGFDNQDQARLSTAVSELARNLYQYASGGNIEFFFSELEPQSFYAKFTDAGPGIGELESVLNGTYVSKNGMGIGLMGSKKLMDFFELESTAGHGTQVIIGKHLDKRARKIRKEDLLGITDQLLANPQESPFEEIQKQNIDLMNVLEQLEGNKNALSELNRELAETNRGVVALYAELDEKASSLQKANEIKTSFLSNMTHEFRTPLSSIISITRMLLQRIDGDLTPEQERQVSYIQKSGESLLDLVSDLLDLSKVEAGKISISTSSFTVNDLLGGIRGMFRPILGPDAAVELKFNATHGDLVLHTDQGKTSQIIRNLVSNAVKFTEKGTITLEVFPEENNSIHIKVIDTGIGIEEKYLHTVFEDFSQVHSKLQAKQKGTGLGLPLSRKLARLLGGDLWVESKPGFGSTFHALIPRHYSGDSEAVLFSNNSPDCGVAQFNVLLIDDDEPSRYVLKNLIKTELDTNFLEASNGQEGFEMILANPPDLIFLDLNMSQLDGFEVLKKLQKDQALKEIPVVINTSKILSKDELDFLTLNTRAILSKERTDHGLATRELRRALVKSGFDYKGM